MCHKGGAAGIVKLVPVFSAACFAAFFFSMLCGVLESGHIVLLGHAVRGQCQNLFDLLRISEICNAFCLVLSNGTLSGV